MKTQCCGCDIRDKDPVIMWNPGNQVVQCHNCGHVYVPRGWTGLQLLFTTILALIPCALAIWAASKL